MQRVILAAGLCYAAVALADAVPGQGTWESTLHPRDVDGDQVIDAYYDSTLDITWLANASLPGTKRFSTLSKSFGRQEVPVFVDYLNTNRYLGMDGWRPPRFRDVDTAGCTRGVDCGQYLDASLSEMAHLYNVTLGNLPNCGPTGCSQPGRGLTNSGPFENLSGGIFLIEEAGRIGEYFGSFKMSTGAQTHCEVTTSRRLDCPAPRSVMPVLDGDIADRVARSPGPAADKGDYVQLHCPGDVNLDGVEDIVAITSGGRVYVRGVDGSASSAFALRYALGLVDTEIAADTDGNGAPELVSIGTTVAEWNDLASGELINVIDFWDTAASVDLAIVEDLSGNGYPEIARLIDGSPYWRGASVQLRDSRTGNNDQVMMGYDSSNRRGARQLFNLPDITGDGAPELGIVMGYRPTGTGSHIFIDNVRTGREPAFVSLKRWFGGRNSPLQAQTIPDPGDDGMPQIAVLKLNVDSDDYNIAVLDTANIDTSNPTQQRFNGIEGHIGTSANFDPIKLLAVPDLNGNQSSEVLLYEVERNGNQHKVRINDGRTLELINSVYFSPSFAGIDAAVCPDLNNNGSAEVAVLGMRLSDGAARVFIKDVVTDELVTALSFPDLQ